MASWIQIKALREQRMAHVTEARGILKRSVDEKRAMTPEEEQAFAKCHELADGLVKQIEALMAQDDAEAEVEASADRFAKLSIETRDGKPNSEQADLRSKAFAKHLRGLPLSETERRSLTIGGSGTGAEVVPDGFWEGYYTKLRTTGSIRQANPFVVTSSDGRDVPYPVYDDTSNEGEIVTAGGSDTSSADPATSRLTLGGYLFSSKVFSLAKDFIQDAAGDAEGAVRKMAVERISAHLDKKLTVGTGTGEPQGAVTGATVGKTATATAAVTYNEILDLLHSLSAPYRDGAVLMMNDATLLAVRKLVDADGNSLWHHGVGQAGAAMSPTIGGVKYIVNPYLANLGAGNKPILYGNFERGYIVKDVTGAELMVDPYTNMKKYLINYCMFSRHTGGVVDTSAIKVLQCAAS